MAKYRTEDFRTPICRLSYAASLFKPRSQEGGKPKFGCTLIFKKEHRKELEARVAEAIKGEWGDKGIEMAKKGLIKSPFLAGDGKEAHSSKTGELNAGMGADVFFIRVSANEDRAPAVWHRDPNKQETEATVYSGCYGKAILNCYTWDHPQNGKGVSFGIQGFQKHAEGERLGGSGEIDKSKWNETVEDAGDAPSETTGGAGAGGLFGE